MVETRDYPHGISENGEGQDSVKICEDTDGDGKADKFTVFADKLNLPTGIVFARKGIIVAAPPKFIYLEDTDGDDKADKREVIMDCWGIRDTHAQASNLHYGFDNWIYGCVGYSGIEGYVGGKQHQFAMGTYRFKPDGSALEFLHQFTNNAWGHSYNDAGDQFGGTANGAPIFFGGIPRYRLCRRQSRHDGQEDQCGRYLPHHHAQLPPGWMSSAATPPLRVPTSSTATRCPSASKAWPWSASPP